MHNNGTPHVLRPARIRIGDVLPTPEEPEGGNAKGDASASSSNTPMTTTTGSTIPASPSPSPPRKDETANFAKLRLRAELEAYGSVNCWAQIYTTQFRCGLEYESRFNCGPFVHDVICEILRFVPASDIFQLRLLAAPFWIGFHTVFETPHSLVETALLATHERSLATVATSPFIGIDAAHNSEPVAVNLRDAPSPWMGKHQVDLAINGGVSGTTRTREIMTHEHTVHLSSDMSLSIAACGAVSCDVTIDDQPLGDVRYNNAAAMEQTRWSWHYGTRGAATVKYDPLHVSLAAGTHKVTCRIGEAYGYFVNFHTLRSTPLAQVAHTMKTVLTPSTTLLYCGASAFATEGSGGRKIRIDLPVSNNPRFPVDLSGMVLVLASDGPMEWVINSGRQDCHVNTAKKDALSYDAWKQSRAPSGSDASASSGFGFSRGRLKAIVVGHEGSGMSMVRPYAYGAEVPCEQLLQVDDLHFFGTSAFLDPSHDAKDDARKHQFRSLFNGRIKPDQFSMPAQSTTSALSSYRVADLTRVVPRSDFIGHLTEEDLKDYASLSKAAKGVLNQFGPLVSARKPKPEYLLLFSNAYSDGVRSWEQ